MLAYVVDFWVVHFVKQHHGHNWQGSGFGYFTCFVEAEFDDRHAGKVNPFGKAEGVGLAAEACQAMYAMVAVTAISARTGMAQNVNDSGKCFP